MTKDTKFIKIAGAVVVGQLLLLPTQEFFQSIWKNIISPIFISVTKKLDLGSQLIVKLDDTNSIQFGGFIESILLIIVLYLIVAFIVFVLSIGYKLINKFFISNEENNSKIKFTITPRKSTTETTA